MRILVVGAGAVGGYLGARLAAAGEDVTFAARGEHARVLIERGLTLHGPNGREDIRLSQIGELTALEGPFDAVFIAVKWPSLESACDELQRLLAPHGVVLPFLNGLDSEDVVARYVGAQRTIAAVAYMSAGLTAPGELYVHGNTRVGLAPYRPGQEVIVDDIARRFERARVPVRRAQDARTMLWEKMVWNAPFNALCGLTDLRALAALDAMPELVKEAMLEVIHVARADGADLPDALADLMMLVTRSEFPDTEPSMLQDVRAGRATEVDILQAAVVARGKQHAVDTPVMRTLTALIRAKTGAARST
jgi:2-dehydropantoate 2-reductase